MKTREPGNQSYRKLKMATLKLKNGSHFDPRTFQVKKSIDITSH